MDQPHKYGLTVDWAETVVRLDTQGLVTDSNRQRVRDLALVAESRIQVLYGLAYRRLIGNKAGQLTLKSIVADSVFRVLAHEKNEGLTRESDGVYSYSRPSSHQNPAIVFTRSETTLLDELNRPNPVGSIFVGGI